MYVNVSSSSSLDDTLSLNFFLEIYLLWNDGTPTYTEINFEEKYDETFFDWANCIVGSRKRKEKNLILVSKAKNNNTTYISLSLAGEYIIPQVL